MSHIDFLGQKIEDGDICVYLKRRGKTSSDLVLSVVVECKEKTLKILHSDGYVNAHKCIKVLPCQYKELYNYDIAGIARRMNRDFITVPEEFKAEIARRQAENYCDSSGAVDW